MSAKLRLLLPILLIAMVLLALNVGRYPVGVADLRDWVGGRLGLLSLAPERSALLERIIVEIRLPRILAAALVGGSLACAGGAFQAVFRNPLVSPGILGVLSGASFGAALGMLVFKSWVYVQLSAFGMGLLAVDFREELTLDFH